VLCDAVPEFSLGRNALRENLFLASLTEGERSHLRPYLKEVSLEFNQVLVEFDSPIEYVYFLQTAITSTVVTTPHGETIEVGLMGAEGFVGLSLLYGVRKSNATVIVQGGGQALRMKTSDFFQQVKTKAGTLFDLLLRYANFFQVMVQQHAACNAIHKIEERMCRWILLTQDRTGSNQFPLTQEYLSLMLGVRRPSVSAIAQKLKEEGLIQYTRGNVTVTDRRGLEARSCICYELIREQMKRTFQKEKRL
jgi:CRP-like cAMP-binding protein